MRRRTPTSAWAQTPAPVGASASDPVRNLLQPHHAACLEFGRRGLINPPRRPPWRCLCRPGPPRGHVPGGLCLIQTMPRGDSGALFLFLLFLRTSLSEKTPPNEQLWAPPASQCWDPGKPLSAAHPVLTLTLTLTSQHNFEFSLVKPNQNSREGFLLSSFLKVKSIDRTHRFSEASREVARFPQHLCGR